jgi:chromosome segregation protein
MYLKSIELTGFKSFPDKTLLSFTNGVTTIVGPNGSCKSNISDAIRWVLGETRAKSLRGGSMQDVIFSGTAKRKALNFAEVSITIDNSDQSIPIDFDEVMITRRVFRSGESEYFINKTACRMKDISELFMDTGLGRDGYSIVGQGKIDEIISGKPQDRRNFFEEASGISKYRHKKDEAEKKLIQTNDNLLRILDIVNELEMRLPGLEKAKEKALLYTNIKDELKGLEISIHCRNIKKWRDDAAVLNKSLDELTDKIEKTKAQLDLIDKDTLALSSQRREADLLTEVIYKKEQDCQYNISTYQNQIALYENEIVRNNQDILRLTGEKNIDMGRIEKFDTLILDRQNKINSLNENKLSIENQIAVFNIVKEKIDNLKKEIEELNNDFEKERQKKSDLTVFRNTNHSKVLYLTEMENNYEGYQKGVKEIFVAKKNGSFKNTTIYGTLADIIKTKNETALAFDAVLGGTLQNIIVEDENDAKIAIDFLKKNSLGRVTFLPVSKIEARDFDFGNAVNEKGVVGKAVDLLTYEDKFSCIVSSLLGKTLIVEDYHTGVFISKKYNNSFRIVTKSGEVFNAGGAIIGGNILKNTGFMSKNASIEALKLEISKTDKAILKSIENENIISNKIEKNTLEIEKSQEGLTQLNEKKAYLTFIDQAIIDETENQKAVIKEKEEYLNGFLEKEKEIAKLEEKNIAITEDIDFKKEQVELEKEILATTSSELLKIKSQKDDIENNFENFQNVAKDVRENHLLDEQARGSLIYKIEKAQSDIENSTQYLWENYEITYSQGLELIKSFENKATNEQKRINELKSQIKALGDVSISSIEEHKEVNERYTFLSTQKNDLTNAKKELELLIDDMLDIMRNNFITQFTLIDEKFQIIFKELFSGGTASLKLLDPLDVLESGIDIIVQPPGKKLESISLLSGGEKAFTAIALLFSVLSLKPLPFCIFDEIEAALDEVNVYKFADYIKSYKEKTQFILVSHRRGTMENADTLYGVTMQEKGVSKLISLKMNEISFR